MCTLTISVSLPLFPFFLLSLSVVIIFCKFIARAVVAHFRIRASNHFAWPTDSPFLRPNPESLDHFMLGIIQELSVCGYKRAPGSCEQVNCVVCLCVIEEGEEVRELRCKHLFHRACLDRWLAYRHATCPLCRGSLVPSKMVAKQGEFEEFEEDLIFPFSSFLSNTDVSSPWWPR
ncbi:hypothetical protein AAC387_Pa03g0841 [Persea americana]